MMFVAAITRGDQPVLARHHHPVAHPRHARARVRHAVDDDETVEAHAYPAEDPAPLALHGRARRDVALREEDGRDRLAVVCRHRTPVEDDLDGWAAFELWAEREPHTAAADCLRWYARHVVAHRSGSSSDTSASLWTTWLC